MRRGTLGPGSPRRVFRRLSLLRTQVTGTIASNVNREKARWKFERPHEPRGSWGLSCKNEGKTAFGRGVVGCGLAQFEAGQGGATSWSSRQGPVRWFGAPERFRYGEAWVRSSEDPCPTQLDAGREQRAFRRRAQR